MKRFLCTLLLLVFFAGCGVSDTPGKNTVSFYYPRQSFHYTSPDGSMGRELRELTDRADDLNYLIHLYSSFGIWKYFTHINVILFLLTLYLTLRSLETQVQLHTLRPFTPSGRPVSEVLRDCLINPGFFIFISSFVVSIALK